MLSKIIPTCFELKISVSELQKNIVAQILTDLEIENFVYGEIDCDIEAEYDPARAQEDLFEKMDHNGPLIIYSEDWDYLKSIQEALESLFPTFLIEVTLNTFLIQKIANQNWRESWRESFRPVLVDNEFAILPPWENPENFTQKHKIIIHPGMAFGTGQHETTRLCLNSMLHVPHAKRFLDVGTGSGILAIAAKYQGIKIVMANDIDPDCLPIAKENALKNNFQDILFIDKPLDEIQEFDFDLIVANIQSRPLKNLVPDILKRIHAKGQIILSGILVSEKDDFIEFLKSQKATVLKVNELNHWCAIICTISKNY